jgi:tRNA wybutosine-synthesizing protein 2
MIAIRISDHINNSMDRAVTQWSLTLSPPPSQPEIENLTKHLGRSYTLYGTLLLLPNIPSDSAPWTLVTSHGDPARDDLFRQIAKHMKITHIASTKPIPPRNDDNQGSENVVRTPTRFTPLYGDFGPAMRDDPPTREDNEAEFWTTAKQNGIAQTWAPRRTMFSRGNIKEKARVLTLPSVSGAISEGEESGEGCAAVDLYAGIGYFTFSYLKAGVSKVLCWDLNPWSIEGLRRGAAANKWRSLTHQIDTVLSDMAKSDVQLLIFNESNVHAMERIEPMRQELPPIRHVNCGLLPTSKGSWETAFRALDARMRGWVHVHENFDQLEIELKSQDVVAEFQRWFDMAGVYEEKVKLEAINRVKTYAPGVWHVVLDICIPPHPAAH